MRLRLLLFLSSLLKTEKRSDEGGFRDEVWRSSRRCVININQCVYLCGLSLCSYAPGWYKYPLDEVINWSKTPPAHPLVGQTWDDIIRVMTSATVRFELLSTVHTSPVSHHVPCVPYWIIKDDCVWLDELVCHQFLCEQRGDRWLSPLVIKRVRMIDGCLFRWHWTSRGKEACPPKVPEEGCSSCITVPDCTLCSTATREELRRVRVVVCLIFLFHFTDQHHKQPII